MQHREEVFLAVRTVCFCLEFLQNEENWSGRRLPAWERFYDDSLILEEEKDWKKYDRRSRREAFRKLERELKERKWQIGEQEIPLRNFLRMGLMLLTEKAGIDWESGDKRLRLMEEQVKINRFQDFREFLEAVYLLGFTELFDEVQNTDDRYSLAGEHRDAKRFLEALEAYIPEKEQADYGLFCRELLEGQARKRREAMERILEEREEYLARTVEEISLFRMFREAFESMSEEAFRKFVTPECEEDEICDWEDLSGEEQESILLERKKNRIRNLASIFVYGGNKVRQRLLWQLSGEEQMLVMEQWIAGYYPRDEEMLENRLRRMAWAIELEVYSRKEDYVIREAMEKLLGRPL